MRDETRRFLTGLSILAALVLGLLYWTRGAPREAAPVVPAATPVPPPQAVSIAVPPGARSGPPKQNAMAAQTPNPDPNALVPPRDPPSTPHATTLQPSPEQKPGRLPFPPALPEAFTAAGFHEAMTRVIADCKFPYSIDEEDCTEFPCIVWGHWDTQRVNTVQVDECPAWKETFGDKVSLYMGGEENGNRLGLVALPPGPRLSDDTFHHIDDRAHGLLDSHDQRRIEGGNSSPELTHVGALGTQAPPAAKAN